MTTLQEPAPRTSPAGPVAGQDLRDGDTFNDPLTGPHTIDRFDKYPGRFIGDTPDEHVRIARCTDGTSERVRDHGHYQLVGR